MQLKTTDRPQSPADGKEEPVFAKFNLSNDGPPAERVEMSAARAAMMRRRRRSLGVLGIGLLISFGAAVLVGGGAAWGFTLVFTLGLVGYVGFLRRQALKDRARRENRDRRADHTRRIVGQDLDIPGASHLGPETLVAIDDDNLELSHLDTMDLTGLIDNERLVSMPQRRAG